MHRRRKAARTRERLNLEATKIRDWLAANQDERRRAKGAVGQSNRTAYESAKIATGKGLIQGYTGVAAVAWCTTSKSSGTMATRIR